MLTRLMSKLKRRCLLRWLTNIGALEGKFSIFASSRFESSKIILDVFDTKRTNSLNRILLEAGANPNADIRNLCTPLAVMAQRGYYEGLRILCR